ncbi:cytochrome c3 family protein [Thiohalobacter sp. IOR34]|uniref:cytochrome c3 family protein n=1 Tax=Thiohalobacter sp. IOR34 TaxID=3057176 RepID=UPI0025AFB544|nr:cytochrome c3 family protein [Thiohalobacter sp. IOR34]WJW76619.1 cytochrome c3 family protein [Thiohalobacter sp. IOR34]
MRVRWLFSLLFQMLAVMPAVAGIASTKHNLSVSGPGTIKSDQESRICIFCHTPHNASSAAPLWNREQSAALYIPYSSSTAVAQPGQPTGASILCLSCHDGTIALGKIISQSNEISMSGGVTTMPPGATRLGTDLSDDHPVSFVYSASLAAQQGELVDPGQLTGTVRLDKSGQLQCTSCHDPHNDSFGKFLVMPNRASRLCTTCHIKHGWLQASHSLSNADWNGIPPDPWSDTDWQTVSDNACLNCHRPHSAGSSTLLLKHQAEEDNCSACHNGNVASKDIMSQFSKYSAHPIYSYTGVHDAGEGTIVSNRHAECQDCHNPHAARSDSIATLGPLALVRGIDINGSGLETISSTHQLCFRCHSDSPGQPAPATPRQISQINTRLEFATTNPSFHPVAGPGRNPDVPSLISPLNSTSQIECTDCHNSDSSTLAGGSGANGPHGSNYEPILIRQYVTLDYTRESPANYALCYGCHDRNSILGNESFSEHRRHIVGQKAPCNICHDPHGISDTQGNSTNNTHLINFDTSVVSPNRWGELAFTDNGRFAGSCSLRCHNRQHRNFSYPRGMGGGGGM